MSLAMHGSAANSWPCEDPSIGAFPSNLGMSDLDLDVKVDGPLSAAQQDCLGSQCMVAGATDYIEVEFAHEQMD